MLIITGRGLSNPDRDPIAHYPQPFADQLSRPRIAEQGVYGFGKMMEVFKTGSQ